MNKLKIENKTIVGYGAPTKATTLMSYFDIGEGIIDYIVCSFLENEGKRQINTFLTNNKNFKLVYGDVRDYKKLFPYVKEADVIIPLAAIVGFPACDRDKQLATAINYYQIKNIVKNISKDQKILYPNTNSG